MKILKFSADWCSPCRTLSALLKDSEYEIQEVNVDTEDELVNKYSVRKVPTLVFLDQKGNEYKRTTGVVSLDQINQIVLDDPTREASVESKTEG